MNTTILPASSNFSSALAALPMALITTAFLFVLMHQLVDAEMEVPVEEPTYVIPDMSMPLINPVPVYEPIEKPEETELAPPAPELTTEFENTEITIPRITTEFGENRKIKIRTGGNVPIAHMLVSPQYPSEALRKGIEGYADVKFDITSSGATANAVVTAAEPAGYFEKAALGAVARWKYQPVVDDDGNAQPFVGLVQRLTFRIQD